MTEAINTPSRGKSGARRKAREYCLALLYQADMARHTPGRVFENAGTTLELLFEAWETSEEERQKLEAEISDYGRRLAEAYFKHASEINSAIEELSHDWALDRMPAIDRNILRMSAAELLYFPDVPVSASINEAVDLAKQYGTPESGKFVNGILGTFVRRYCQGRLTSKLVEP